jgi:hypothetical protein
MKAIIEVEKLGDNKYLILSKRYGNGQEWLADNEIEIVQEGTMDLTVNKAGSTQENTMSDIKLTREQFEKIRCVCSPNMKYTAYEIAEIKGWIVKDKIEQAIDALKDFYNRYYLSAGINEFHGIKDYADTVIELLQNKIKELEK